MTPLTRRTASSNDGPLSQPPGAGIGDGPVLAGAMPAVSEVFPEKATRVPSNAPTRTTPPSSQAVFERFIVILLVPRGWLRVVGHRDPGAAVACVPRERDVRARLQRIGDVREVGVLRVAVVHVAGAVVGLAIEQRGSDGVAVEPTPDVLGPRRVVRVRHVALGPIREHLDRTGERSPREPAKQTKGENALP